MVMNVSATIRDICIGRRLINNPLSIKNETVTYVMGVLQRSRTRVCYTAGWRRLFTRRSGPIVCFSTYNVNKKIPYREHFFKRLLYRVLLKIKSTTSYGPSSKCLGLLYNFNNKMCRKKIVEQQEILVLKY